MRVRTLIVATTLPAVALAAPALASRAPSKSEAAAIKRVAMARCEKAGPPDSSCHYHGARVSTKNRRYAWAEVTTDGFSAVLLRRPTTRSKRFKIVGIQGGGIGACSYWRARAPRAVLRDLHVNGLLADLATTGNCGRD